MKNLIEIDFDSIGKSSSKDFEISQKKLDGKEEIENKFNSSDFEINEDFINKKIKDAISDTKKDVSSTISNIPIIDETFFDNQFKKQIKQKTTEKKVSIKKEDSQKKEIVVDKPFDEKFKYFLIRIIYILQTANTESKEEALKSYTKALIYILEKFKIFEDKTKQIEILIYLRKSIGDIGYSDLDLKLGYIKELSDNTSYIITSGLAKEDLFLLYNIFFDNFSELKKEVGDLSKINHKENKVKILKKIGEIEKEMLGEYLKTKDIKNKINKKRLEIRKKREDKKLNNQN
ncbi:hypothetical protein H3C61_04150 [Candidatus Gracilibacteria bacterium]|nr:hypothetical protein [Candidatus Gracilibacteria bacterium]